MPDVITTTIWTTWTGQVAHAVAGRATPGDIRNGAFPTVCGLYAPDPMDGGAASRVAPSSMSRCKRCAHLTREVTPA